MDIRQRLEVFGNTKELAELLYRRTRTSPDELLAECRDTLLVMFSVLHEAADEIERLQIACLIYDRKLHDKDLELDAVTKELDAVTKERDKLLKGCKVYVPTITMEQAFATEYRRGYQAGIKAAMRE